MTSSGMQKVQTVMKRGLRIETRAHQPQRMENTKGSAKLTVKEHSQRGRKCSAENSKKDMSDSPVSNSINNSNIMRPEN